MNFRRAIFQGVLAVLIAAAFGGELRPREFLPHGSEQRVEGELVSVDFIRRTGQFRDAATGELVAFTMPPFGTSRFHNSEADLRDLPLGTHLFFALHRDSQGAFTRLAALEDQFTRDARDGVSYRLEAANLGEGILQTARQDVTKNQLDLGRAEWRVRAETRVWKGDRQIPLAELAPGDALLINLTGKTAANPGWCSDLWVGADTHQRATENQRKRFAEFTKKRGVPGWIDRVNGNQLAITFFSGDPRVFQQTWATELVAGKGATVCVANDELRTWNPGVDGERSTILETSSVPTNLHGCSGLQIVAKVPNLLEGFRPGRVVRVFAAGWKSQDQYYGESLMGYGFARMQNQELIENAALEYPEQFPFRTDHGNAHLPWFKVQSGTLPPPFAEHLVFGELLRADAARGAGQFRADRTGETIDFTLLPDATVRFLNAKASLADVPVGTRCRFHLFQDENGAFTRASLVSDEFSHSAANVITFRVEELRLSEEKVRVAHQIPLVKNYNGDMERPPDIARSEWRVGGATRVWKGEQQVPLSALAVGDEVLANFTGEQRGAPARCTDLWIGAETHKLVTERQTRKLAAAQK